MGLNELVNMIYNFMTLGNILALLLKSRLLCAPMLNRNTETEILEEERDGFIFLPGRREDTAG